METNVLPEFKELHEVYERAIDVREALLRDAPANIGRELYGELVGRYSSLAIEISALLVF